MLNLLSPVHTLRTRQKYIRIRIDSRKNFIEIIKMIYDTDMYYVLWCLIYGKNGFNWMSCFSRDEILRLHGTHHGSIIGAKTLVLAVTQQVGHKLSSINVHSGMMGVGSRFGSFWAFGRVNWAHPFCASSQRKFRNLTSDYTESCCWRSVNQEMWSRRCDTAEMWDMRIWRVGSARNAVFFHSFVASQARKVRS